MKSIKKDPVQVQGGIFRGKLHGPGPGMDAAIYLDSILPDNGQRFMFGTIQEGRHYGFHPDF